MNPTVHLAPTTVAKGVSNSDVEGGVPVHSFLGIPYAHPPVGELRFCAPQPCDLWTGERDCTKFGAVCPQDFVVSKFAHGEAFVDDYESSEDCLYLNITTPSLDPNARLPVMFWIHGGGFAVGFSNMYRGDALASLNDIVFVSCNYRLGAFGFLTTADDAAPGNYGLLDQAEALKWVKKHISSFGGDPENITIFGESAGGWAVSYLMLSDTTKGLFQRAICQSGAATCPLLNVDRKGGELLTPHLSKLGFQGGSNEELIKYLRQKTPEEIIEAIPALSIGKPFVDGKFLSDTPRNLYKSGRFQALPLITGVTTHEGNFMLRMQSLHKAEIPVPSLEDVRKYFKATISTAFKENLDAITDELLRLYIDPDSVGDREKILKTYCDLHGDFMFNGCHHFTALNHSKHAPTFAYLFAKRTPYSTEPDWVIADHGNDVYYTLGGPFADTFPNVKVEATQEDKDISKALMTYWTNFAKTGDPNGPGLAEWTPFTPDANSFMTINHYPAMNTEPYTATFNPSRMEFWMKCDGQM